MKTIQYLNNINKRYKVSDYKASELLQITRSSVSKYRTKNGTFDDETAIKVAELLEINPQIVLADIHAERAKIRKTKKIWLDIAEALRTTTAIILTAIIALSYSNEPMNSIAYTIGTAQQYILC